MDTLFVMNFTLPSPMTVFTPPECRLRAEVGEQKASHLLDRIGLGDDLLREPRGWVLGRLVRHLQTLAGGLELPAVVAAPDGALALAVAAEQP